MGNKPSVPPPLDANAIAGQQRQENTRAAAQNIAANRVNQTDQFGNQLTYRQTGRDRFGNPTYSATQTMGERGQQFLGGLSGLAGQYFQGAGDLLNTPLDANKEVADEIYRMQETRVAPRFEKSRAALETRLANQGINIGSEAWDNAFENFTQAENDAYTQMALQGQAQAFNQALAGRNQRVGELGGLAGLGVTGMGRTIDPSYVAVPQVNIPGVDVSNLAQMQQAQEMNTYNQRMQERNATIGAIAGTVGTIAGAAVGGPMGARIGGRLGSSAAGGGGSPSASYVPAQSGSPWSNYTVPENFWFNPATGSFK